MSNFCIFSDECSSLDNSCDQFFCFDIFSDDFFIDIFCNMSEDSDISCCDDVSETDVSSDESLNNDAVDTEPVQNVPPDDSVKEAIHNSLNLPQAQTDADKVEFELTVITSKLNISTLSIHDMLNVDVSVNKCKPSNVSIIIQSLSDTTSFPPPGVSQTKLMQLKHLPDEVIKIKSNVISCILNAVSNYSENTRCKTFNNVFSSLDGSERRTSASPKHSAPCRLRASAVLSASPGRQYAYTRTHSSDVTARSSSTCVTNTQTISQSTANLSNVEFVIVDVDMPEDVNQVRETVPRDWCKRKKDMSI